MAPRATWKGYIKLDELAIPVALYAAASSSERITFHMLNRQTGDRVQRQFVDEMTGDPVPRENQVKGFEVAKGDYVMLEPDEIAAAVPESDKTLSIEAFVACNEIDDTHFDRPYYLAPASPIAGDAFGLLRDGLRTKKVAALARTVLFRRVRTLLIRASGAGLVASTLNFDYEVRSARETFGDIPKLKIPGEMLDLARHIIDTKRGEFDPRAFVDRYAAALAELVRAKLAGKPVAVRKPARTEKVVNLMEALRQSAGAAAPSRKREAAGSRRSKQAASKRKPAGQTAHRSKTG